MKKIRVVITGATGMVGEGVQHVCLQNDLVEQVLVVGRKACGIKHDKLSEILIPDFFTLENIKEKLSGYDACFFCLGVSSVGMFEEQFTKTSYALTMSFAEAFAQSNPQAHFFYVSGAGTDSTEHGKIMWARVKGRTENALQKLFPNNFYAMRPGYLHPIAGMRNTHRYYSFISWLYPLLRVITPSLVNTLNELALSMIHLTLHGSEKKHIEVKDIRLTAAQKY